MTPRSSTPDETQETTVTAQPEERPPQEVLDALDLNEERKRLDEYTSITNVLDSETREHLANACDSGRFVLMLAYNVIAGGETRTVRYHDRQSFPNGDMDMVYRAFPVDMHEASKKSETRTVNAISDVVKQPE